MMTMLWLRRIIVIHIGNEAEGISIRAVAADMVGRNIGKFCRRIGGLRIADAIGITVHGGHYKQLVTIRHCTIPNLHIADKAAIRRSGLEPERRIRMIQDIVLHQHFLNAGARMASCGNGTAMTLTKHVVKGPDVSGFLLCRIAYRFTHAGREVHGIITGIKKVVKDDGILCVSDFDTITIITVIGQIFYIV